MCRWRLVAADAACVHVGGAALVWGSTARRVGGGSGGVAASDSCYCTRLPLQGHTTAPLCALPVAILKTNPRRTDGVITAPAIHLHLGGSPTRRNLRRPARWWSRARHLQRRAPSGRPARASCRPVGQLTRSVGLVASFVFSTAAARVMLPPALMINGLRQAECRDTLTLPGQAGVRLASW